MGILMEGLLFVMILKAFILSILELIIIQETFARNYDNVLGFIMILIFTAWLMYG
jgi:hypothetical protein